VVDPKLRKLATDLGVLLDDDTVRLAPRLAEDCPQDLLVLISMTISTQLAVSNAYFSANRDMHVERLMKASETMIAACAALAARYSEPK
jgi:hypothetical protein